MGLRKIKISELTLSDTLKGLYTIGVKVVGGIQTSVKVSLEFIQTACDNAVKATTRINDIADHRDKIVNGYWHHWNESTKKYENTNEPAKGDTGAQGIQGLKGEKGDAGTPGSTGAPGSKGDTGATGAQGAKGDKGDAGSIGAKGDTGSTGDYYEYRYAVNGSTSVPPSLSTTSAAPSGWTTAMPSVGSLQYLWCTAAKKSASGALLQNWGTPTRVTGSDGTKGDKGDKGDSPAVVFRGDYSSTKTYYGTSKRIDCVKYNGSYYVARVDAGDGFTNKVPSSTSLYWNTFGSQFESVATELLLAETANIGGWKINNERLESQSGGAYLDGKTGEVNITGRFESNRDGNRIIFDPAERSLKFINDINQTLIHMTFEKNVYGGINFYHPKITLNDYGNKKAGNPNYIMEISGYEIRVKKDIGDQSYLIADGLGMFRPGEASDPSFSASRYWQPPSGGYNLYVGMTGLPTSAPTQSGRVWRDGNTLKIVP